MKRFLVLAVVVLAAISCKRNLDSGFQVRPTQAGPTGPNPDGLPTQVLPLVIDQDITLTNDICWILDGKCYVKDAKLTIDEGTRIEGIKKSTNDSSSALIITRSATIDARGSSTNPIIFSSHETTQAVGDWGGVVLLGGAPINKPDTSIEGINLPSVPDGVDIKYGGGGAGLGDEDDNSGIMQFVRIEYAGARIADNNELNGLTCGGVGRGTKLQFIEVALGADDAFEFFGGTVDLKYAIAFSPNDDCFDTDFGYKGRIQFAVAVRRPAEAFADGNGNEADNDGQATGATPVSRPEFSNITVLGLASAAEVAAEGTNAMLNAARLRRNTNYWIGNSAFGGYNGGITVDAGGTPGAPFWAPTNINNCTIQAYVSSSLLLNSTNQTTVSSSDANNTLVLEDPFDKVTVDGVHVFRPTSGSPLLVSNGATVDFTGFTNGDHFFVDTVTYRGAFSPYADDFNSHWDQGGWAKYDY